MKKAPKLEKTAINPDQLVGTKWIGWGEFVGNQMAIEFIDQKNCVYTSRSMKFPMTYTVSEGKIFISGISVSFELSGNVLFNNNIPAFEKAA